MGVHIVRVAVARMELLGHRFLLLWGHKASPARGQAECVPQKCCGEKPDFADTESVSHQRTKLQLVRSPRPAHASLPFTASAGEGEAGLGSSLPGLEQCFWDSATSCAALQLSKIAVKVDTVSHHCYLLRHVGCLCWHGNRCLNINLEHLFSCGFFVV